MDRPKWVAILTGALSIGIAVGYLILVQVLNLRGGENFQPAPTQSK